MKKLTALILVLFVCHSAFAQISTVHRGYDIHVNNSAAENIKSISASEIPTPRNLFLILSPGIINGSNMQLDNTEFNKPATVHFDLSLHYFPYEYLGLGASFSHYFGHTKKKYNIFTPGDSAAVRYNSSGISFLMLGRYPMKNLEPYLSAGITRNINYIARDYTNNTKGENGQSIGCLFEAGLRLFMFEPVLIGASMRYIYNRQDSKNSKYVDLSGASLFFNIGYSF